MKDIGLSTPHQKHEVKYHGVSHIFGLTVGTAIQVAGHEMITLQDQSGALRVTVPRRMVPFAEIGATVMVNLGFIAGEVVSSSAILRVIE